MRNTLRRSTIISRPARRGLPPCAPPLSLRQLPAATSSPHIPPFPPARANDRPADSKDQPPTFQNCLLASLPPTRLRILAPPGCSSTKEATL